MNDKMKTEPIERRFTGWFVPVELIEKKGLTWVEKLMILEIDALSNDAVGCLADDSYFAELFQVDVKTIKKSISKLIQFGYMFCHVVTVINMEGLPEERRGLFLR
jgi:hypothetical protein